MSTNIDQVDSTTPSPAHANIERAADQLAESISTAAHNWAGDEGTTGIDPAARDLLSKATSEITRAAAAHRASAEKAWQALSDKTMYPDGRAEIASQAREQGRADIRDAVGNATALIDVAEGMLIAESAPSLGETKTERFQNRTEAERRIRMVVESTSDTGQLTQHLQNLAQMDSSISALLTNDTEFTDLLLASRGVKPEQQAQMKTLIRNAAVEARAKRGDRNAQLALRLGRLRGAAGAAKDLVNH